jgi:hypothetical protein
MYSAKRHKAEPSEKGRVAGMGGRHECDVGLCIIGPSKRPAATAASCRISRASCLLGPADKIQEGYRLIYPLRAQTSPRISAKCS